MHLREACREVMNDRTVMDRYPQGVTANDVMREVEKKHPGGFPLISVLDVYDEMTAFYGEPS